MLYLIELPDKLRVLVGNVLLDKGGGLEQLLARFASETPFVFLFDEWFDCLRKFSSRT